MTYIDLGLDCDCTNAKGEKLLGRYVDGPIVSSLLSLEESYEEYLARCRKKSKGAAMRQAKKADNLGCKYHTFDFNNYLFDVYAINTSKEIRCGKPMTPAYHRTADQLRRPSPRDWCEYHWLIPFGVFFNDTLLAYTLIKRNKDIALYSTILGHGDYLKHGVMHRMHLAIREHLDQSDIKFIMYAGHESGTEGLKLWKKNLLFQPHQLTTNPKKAVRQK
jgi:hypothetical protein